MTLTKHGSRCLKIHSLRIKAQSLLRARHFKSANEVLVKLRGLMVEQIKYEDRADTQRHVNLRAVRSRSRSTRESERRAA